MKKFFCFATFYIFSQPFLFTLFAQNLVDSIQEKEAAQILNFLSSDDLKGRGNFTPGLIQAGYFIGDKFKEYGLQPFPGSLNFYQPFNAGGAKSLNRDNVMWNGKSLDQSNFLYLTSTMIPGSRTLKDFHVVEYDGIFNDSIYLAHWLDTTNTLVWLKRPGSNNLKAFLESYHNPTFAPLRDILFVSASDLPTSLIITTNRKYKKNVLFNMIGILPGKTRSSEIIIFSAHYDHLGSTPSSGDHIYNGANDDASGATAVLLLAKYFALRNDNERTILFCAFAGEELGLLGSTFLASKLNPESVKAMINIEMVGKTNVTGINSFFLTGAKYSTLEKMMNENLKNSPVKIFPDPETGKLFQRSDNFPFALKGVPAHTIMCSDDNDECYHQVCDEARDIDIANMIRVIRGIAICSLTIVSGKDTPTRIRIDEIE